MLCSKAFKLDFSSTWTENLQMYEPAFEEAKELEINCQICYIIGKGREFQRNIYFCFTHYAKSYDCVIITVINS